MNRRGIGAVVKRALRSYATKEAAAAPPKPQQNARPFAGKGGGKGPQTRSEQHQHQHQHRQQQQQPEQPPEILSARADRLVKALTWTSCASLGLYLVCLNDWKGDTVFSDIKPSLKKAVTALHKSE
mmetsp:Transcript_11011/g.28306  ORF Transcript_11011/g.28306 Transcript_11011/m.28306 type:complete len:126 (+) Transcript_11011:90-467(+)